jgi:hypothetical protein
MAIIVAERRTRERSKVGASFSNREPALAVNTGHYRLVPKVFESKMQSTHFEALSPREMHAEPLRRTNSKSSATITSTQCFTQSGAHSFPAGRSSFQARRMAGATELAPRLCPFGSQV